MRLICKDAEVKRIGARRIVFKDPLPTNPKTYPVELDCLHSIEAIAVGDKMDIYYNPLGKGNYVAFRPGTQPTQPKRKEI